MQKWEYKVICHGDQDRVQAKLNESGQEGWEFVAATAAAPDPEIVVHTVYLRRPLPQEPEGLKFF